MLQCGSPRSLLAVVEPIAMLASARAREDSYAKARTANSIEFHSTSFVTAEADGYTR